MDEFDLCDCDGYGFDGMSFVCFRVKCFVDCMCVLFFFCSKNSNSYF